MARITGAAPGNAVEAAPSHDGSPTYAVYKNVPPGGARPLFALRIYDTTAGAANHDHLRHVAKTIFEKTWRTRSSVGREAKDRVEVVGLSMPAHATDEERAKRCQQHQIAEVAARKSARLKDWCLPGTFKTESYLFHIDVITRLEVGWEEVLESTNPFKRYQIEPLEERQMDPFGIALTVNWGVGPHLELEDGEDPWPEMSFTANRIFYLDISLTGARHKIEWFYTHYVAYGDLDREFE